MEQTTTQESNMTQTERVTARHLNEGDVLRESSFTLDEFESQIVSFEQSRTQVRIHFANGNSIRRGRSAKWNRVVS